MKRDSTPEFNASYHYKDENVEFDSPEPPNVMSNDISVDKQNNGLNSDLLVDNPSVSVNGINNSLFSKVQKNDLLNSEPNPSTSRRDTYFIDDGPIVTEQNVNVTPAPRRSILKCSKTTKPHRSRSSCRMVQFARLPKSDSRINKISKSRFNSGSNFLVTSDEVNEADYQLMNCNVEEYDDDLDGVQPLDSSVASLIVSPILDNSGINKSIKRGSRGNKVMSLINSFEKRTNESPKHSIRASDLLSMSESKYGNKLPENDSINNSNFLQESLSSSRRINLENIFISEDSSKNISNEPTLQNINNSVQNVEMFSNSEKTLFNITETENKSKDISSKDLPENVSSCEYNFASPLNILSQTNSGIITKTSVSEDQPIFVDPENVEITTNNSVETVNNQLNDSYNIKSFSKTTTNKYLNMFDTVDKEIDKTYDSQGCKKICANEDEKLDIYKLAEKEMIKVKNDILENTKESICVESNQSEVQNNVSKSENDEQSSDEKSPSKVVEYMSKMFNFSVDELEITLPQQTETINDSFILVEKDDLQKSLKKNKTNKRVGSTTATSTKNLNSSLIKSVMVQLDTNDSNIHSHSNDLNTILTDNFSTTNNDETITSDIIPEKAETENPILQISDIHSKKSSITLSTIESVIDINSSTSKTTLSVKNNINTNDSNNVELSTKTKEIEPSIVQKSNLNSTTITCSVISIDSLEEVPSSNVKKDETNSKHTLNVTNLKQLDKSVQSMVNASTVHNDKRNTRSSKQIIEMNVSSDIDRMEENENMQKSLNNLEHTSFTTADTSIGKPQYESTPWTSSKTSKTPKHSTTSEISNKTPHNESDNMGSQKRSSISPFPEPEIWAQMMKDFNASVKKASVSQDNTINISNCSKILFNQESRSNEIAIKLTKEESTLNYTNVINNTSNIQKESTIQHSLRSSYSFNNTKKSLNESDLGERSTRSNSKSLTKTINMSRSKNNDIQLNNTVDGLKKNDTSSGVLKRKLSISPQSLKTLSTKNKKTNLETSSNTLPDLKHSTSTTEHDNNSVSSTSKSLLVSNKTRKMTRNGKTNSSPIVSPPRRNLRDRANKNVSIKKYTKPNKITSSELTTSNDTEMSPSTSRSANGFRSSKRKLRNNEELKSPVQKCTISVSFKTNTRKLRGNIKSNESTLPAKRNITRKNTSLTKSSPPKLDNKNKTSSSVKTKSTNVGKQIKTKKLQLKSTKTSLNDSSENGLISEGENNSHKFILAETNKEKIKKNDIDRIKRRKDESSDDLLQVSKRGRKRAAETPISQPNPKESKRDILSKVASTTLSRCSNSPPKRSPSELKRVETLNSKDSSLVSTRVTRKDKQKNVEKTQAKKRGINSEDSSDSARKITRNNIQAINCENKSEDSDSVPSVRKATRNYVQVKNSSDSAPSKLSRKITRNNVLTKKAEINSEDSSDSAPSTRKVTRNNVQTKNSLDSVPSARITTRNKVQAKRTKINSEDSSDSAPSTQKMTRKVTAKDKETEINKSTSTSKMKVQNTDAKESKTRTQEKIDM